MSISRRDFVRKVIIGATAPFVLPSCSPIGEAASAQAGLAETKLQGESFALCHRVRDRDELPLAPPSETHDFVVVGGGPSGIAAAYELRHENVLLLEKEAQVGGNAFTDHWDGIPYSTGAVVSPGHDSKAVRFYREIGAAPHRIESPNWWRLDGRMVRLQEEGLEPFFEEASSRQSLREFRELIGGIDFEAEANQLDTTSFDRVLGRFHPRVQEVVNLFLEAVGGTAGEISALAGALVSRVHILRTKETELYAFPGGLGPAFALAAEKIDGAGRGRILTDATVYRIAPLGDGWVQTSFFRHGEPVTVKSRAAIVAIPKFMAKHVIAGLPQGHREAMNQMKYAPYPTVAICSEGVIFDRGFSVWTLERSPVIGVNMNDWVLYQDGGPADRRQVLSCSLSPVRITRAQLLDDRQVLAICDDVARYLERIFPGAQEKMREIRFYRKGHPWHIPIVGMTSRIQPILARPFGRIFFAHSDSAGIISDVDTAIEAGERAAAEARQAVTAVKERSRVPMAEPGLAREGTKHG